jgi:hypothetical protein
MHIEKRKRQDVKNLRNRFLFHSPADIVMVMETGRMTGLGHVARMKEIQNAN